MNTANSRRVGSDVTSTVSDTEQTGVPVGKTVEPGSGADRDLPVYAHLRVPRRVLADLAWAVLTRGRRSFRVHAINMLPGIRPDLSVLGTEHIPAGGPGVIAVNHYNRPGFWSPWFPAVISAQIPVEVHWTMTDAFTLPGHPLGKVYRWMSHQLLVQVARVYGFSTMPPMPPLRGEERLRAAAIQRLVWYVRNHRDALLGLAPEGGDQPGGVLALPPAGFGKLALLLARRGMPFYPVGVFEEDGCLCVCFGERYYLSVPEGINGNRADCLAREEIMGRIASCLPGWLKGHIADNATL